MKKMFLPILLALVSFTVNRAEAQLTVAGGMALWNNDNTVGIQFRAEYRPLKRVAASFDYILYLESESTKNLSEFNLNGHLYFNPSSSFQLYALRGVNSLRSTLNEGNASSRYAGNVGLGFRYPLTERLFLIGEGKYITGRSSASVSFVSSLSVGFRF